MDRVGLHGIVSRHKAIAVDVAELFELCGELWRQ